MMKDCVCGTPHRLPDVPSLIPSSYGCAFCGAQYANGEFVKSSAPAATVEIDPNSPLTGGAPLSTPVQINSTAVPTNNSAQSTSPNLSTSPDQSAKPAAGKEN
ncbi:hypothetical protein CCAX7_54590 [Capsulimonas corticalis]|uniref:Uncharacterized protein n=1 Tax=Capsulimonas corticalis TaxID=2219043 RepID=A0A402D5S7_9BACT|nr:hypothetical protein [Capsulimonas corticalis]BDI33408.1 hypothetical protein CCAX7_54590 [Capsulimonas corticalis]